MLDKGLLTALHELPQANRQETINQIVSDVSENDALALLYDWSLWGRSNQVPPDGDWSIWLLNGGRGAGKTRAGAEFIRNRQESGLYGYFTIVGETSADARDIMIEGESGLLAVSPPWNRPRYRKTLRRLDWPNGAVGLVFSADDPEQLRGPQSEVAWADEVGKWRYQDAIDNLLFGLRLGPHPHACFTTTPRETRMIRNLLKDPTVHVTHSTTFDNKDNLSPSFFSRIVGKYEGTRIGRRELYAELLDDNQNALWNRAKLDDLRRTVAPQLTLITISIDPQASNGEDSASTGIMVVGRGIDDHGYVLEDCTIKGPPSVWGRSAVAAYHKYKANRMVGEANNGGDMIEHVIRSVPGGERINYRKVHATRGKSIRAEPVSVLYDQNRFHHIGYFAELEDQMCEWTPDSKGPSPDHMDALVWGAYDLFIDGTEEDDPVIGW
jgi:phage terminase large subunit-like protein